MKQSRKRQFLPLGLLVVFSLLLTIMVSQLAPEAVALQLGQQPERAVYTPSDKKHNIEVVNQFGGTINSITAQGNYVYTNVGPRLVILDMTAPNAPVVVGQSAPLTKSFLDIVARGDKTYVLSQGFSLEAGGLHAFDTSDVTVPREVGFVNHLGTSQRLTIKGNYAYTAAPILFTDAYDGLRIIDVTSSQEMKLVSFSEEVQSARDVVVVGQLAYVVSDKWQEGGLYIFDVSDPAAPHLISSLSMFTASDLAIQNGFAYVTTYNPALDSYYLAVVDISDPLNPYEVGSWGPTEYILAVAIVSDRAYVWTWDGSATVIEILNIAIPTSPTTIGSIPLSEPVDGFFVSENTLFFTVAGRQGFREQLHMVDVSIPTEPNEIGVFEAPLAAAHFTAVNPPYTYVVSEDTLEIFNTANLTEPIHLSTHPIPDDISDIAFHQNYIYLTDLSLLDDPGHLRIIDVSDPTAVIEVSVIPIAFPSSIEVIDQTAYVTDSGDLLNQNPPSLDIFDVSEPLSPVNLGSYSFEDSYVPRDAIVRDGIAYVALAYWNNLGLPQGRLQIFDVSDPVTPHLLATQNLPFATYQITLWNNYVYITADSYLHIFDVTATETPIEINRLPIDPRRGLTIQGSFLFVTSTNHKGIDMIDISNPKDPLLIEKIDTYETIYSGFTHITPGLEKEVYVSLREQGVFVLQPYLREQITATIPSASRALSSTIMAQDAEITFPLETFPEITAVSYNRLGYDTQTGGLTGVDFIFDLTAVVSNNIQLTQADQPFTITVHYPPGPVIEETLNLYRWNGNAWESVPSSILDMEANTITIATNHLGVWAILGESYRTHLPIVLR